MRSHEFITEVLKQVNGKWALVSKSDPKKVLQYYDGPEGQRPSKEWVSKVERRVHAHESLNTVKTFNVAEIAAKHNVSIEQIDSELAKGMQIEKEHTTDAATAREIALDHLLELPDYYTRLVKMER